MAVSGTTSEIVYDGNGSDVTPYPIPFAYTDASQIKVQVQPSGGSVSELETAYYSVTSAGVVTGTAYPASTKVAIRRVLPLTQPTNYPTSGKFPASSHEAALDRNVLMSQQLQAQINRALRFSAVDGAQSEFPAPATRASKYFYFDSDGVLQFHTAAQILANLELEIPDSVVDRPTTTFADAAGRAAAVPDFTGQAGLQLDTGQWYRSTGTSAGNWSLDKTRSDLDTLIAGDAARAYRGALKVSGRAPWLSIPMSFGALQIDYPVGDGWTDNDLSEAPHFPNFNDHHAFPRMLWIPQRGRLIVTFRVADYHLNLDDAAIQMWITDDLGATWRKDTDFLYTGTDDFRSFGMALLADDRIIGTYMRVNDSEDSGGKTYHLCARYSSDFGDTWTDEEVLLTDDNPAIYGHTTKPFVCSDGSIIVPVYYWSTFDFSTFSLNSQCRVIRSTDGGATWGSEITVASDPGVKGFTEMNLFEIPETGTLVGLIRAENDTLHRVTSSDFGLTWSAVTDVTPDNYEAGVPVPLLLPNGLLYLMSRFTDSSPVNAGGLWYSTDYGVTWAANGVHGAIAATANLDLIRDDLLNSQWWAEGDLALLGDGVVLAVMGNENSSAGSSATGTEWETGRAYVIGNVVRYNGANYACNTAHTAGDFATDLAATRWIAGNSLAWVTAKAYAVGNVVTNGGSSYICLEAHTSGTFATDLAASKWGTGPEFSTSGPTYSRIWSRIVMRTWINGMGSGGRDGNGIILAGGGRIAFDNIKLPQLTTAQRDALTAEAGMSIFNTASQSIETFNGLYWESNAPIDLPNFGLTAEVDLNPEQESTGALATWTDQALSNDFAAAGTTPVNTSIKIGRKPAVVFGGAGDYSEGAAADWAFLHNDSTDWAIFIPFRTASANPNSSMALFSTTTALSSAGNGLIVCLEDRSSVGASGTVQVGLVSGGWDKDLRGEEISGVGATGVPNDIWTPQSWHVLGLTYQRDGGSDPVTGVLSLYMDGTLIAADSTTNASRTAVVASATAHIGSFNSSANFFTGDMGRILIFKDLPTADEVRVISASLLRG